TWDAKNNRLLGIWDKPNILLAMTRKGKILKRWNKVRGSNQEGIVLIDCDLYMAEDSGDLYKYDKPLD
ncbi:MAG: SdiA-regulated domain-containing protein, partial [Phycisphaeraceae bacterium JB051]